MMGRATGESRRSFSSAREFPSSTEHKTPFVFLTYRLLRERGSGAHLEVRQLSAVAHRHAEWMITTGVGWRCGTPTEYNTHKRLVVSVTKGNLAGDWLGCFGHHSVSTERETRWNQSPRHRILGYARVAQGCDHRCDPAIKAIRTHFISLVHFFFLSGGCCVSLVSDFAVCLKSKVPLVWLSML
jgi:hypothetical protein